AVPVDGDDAGRAASPLAGDRGAVQPGLLRDHRGPRLHELRLQLGGARESVRDHRDRRRVHADRRDPRVQESDLVRLATVRTAGGTRAARRDGDELVLLDGVADVAELLSREGWEEAAAGADGERVAFEAADLAPLVVRPPKIVCLGMNYRSHVEEMGREAPSHPT